MSYVINHDIPIVYIVPFMTPRTFPKIDDWWLNITNHTEDWVEDITEKV